MSESNVSSRIKRLLNTYSGLVLMGAVGIPIGIIVGAICALFGRVLLAIGAFRDEHITLLLPFLALMGFAIVFSYRTWGKGTNRGMSLVFDVDHGHEDAISPRLVPLVMLSTWGTHLFGGATNTLLAPILIGCEVFGFCNLPMLFIVCVVAYLFNMDKSIYALQKRAQKDVQAGGLNRKRRPTLRLYSGTRFPLGTPFGKRILL